MAVVLMRLVVVHPDIQAVKTWETRAEKKVSPTSMRREKAALHTEDVPE